MSWASANWKSTCQIKQAPYHSVLALHRPYSCRELFASRNQIDDISDPMRRRAELKIRSLVDDFGDPMPLQQCQVIPRSPVPCKNRMSGHFFMDLGEWKSTTMIRRYRKVFGAQLNRVMDIFNQRVDPPNLGQYDS